MRGSKIGFWKVACIIAITLLMISGTFTLLFGYLWGLNLLPNKALTRVANSSPRTDSNSREIYAGWIFLFSLESTVLFGLLYLLAIRTKTDIEDEAKQSAPLKKSDFGTT